MSASIIPFRPRPAPALPPRPRDFTALLAELARRAQAGLIPVGFALDEKVCHLATESIADAAVFAAVVEAKTLDREAGEITDAAAHLQPDDAGWLRAEAQSQGIVRRFEGIVRRVATMQTRTPAGLSAQASLALLAADACEGAASVLALAVCQRVAEGGS